MTGPDSSPLAERYRREPDDGPSTAGLPRAVDLITGQQVALMSVALDGLGPDDIAVVEDWARHISRLQHRNVVSVLDVVRTPTELVLVLQHWPSRPAEQLVAETGRLAPERVVSVGSRLADGLAAAHEAGIQHHDITPATVWFDEIGWAKLADFGITRAVRTLRRPALASNSAYRAPEASQAGHAPEPADVYGLGATLTALAGATPGRRRGSGAVRGPLGDVLGSMTQRDPALRPTAAAARDRLAALEAASQPFGHPTSWPNASPWDPSNPRSPEPTTPSERRWFARPSILVPLLVVLLVALGLGGVFLARRMEHPPPGSVAAPGPPTASGSAPAPAPPGWSGTDYLPAPARVDLCALRDTVDLSGFGAITKVLGGRYSECSEDIALAAGGTAHVSFSIWAPGPMALAPTQQRGDLTIFSPDSDGRGCVRQIELPSRDHLDVTVTMDGAAQSACAIADVGVNGVVNYLTANGAVPTVAGLGDPNSLRRQDACQLLAPADVAQVPGIDPSARIPLYANWACSWGNNPNRPGFAPPAVVVQFQRAVARNPQDAGTLYQIGGRDVYVRLASGDNDQGMCLADIVNRVTADSGGRPYAELAILSVYADVSATRQCQLAVGLAKRVIAQLPPP